MAHPLGELALLFLRLGATAFGGPAAHIAMMDEEVVQRRGWMTREEFLDLLGATNLIPGPNSTEMAIHIGHRRAGWPGLIVAGVSFIVPAMVLVGIIAWGYVRFGRLPQVGAVMNGIKPVIIAIVLQALWGLARTAVKTVWLGFVTVGAIVANALGVHELIVLGAAGAVVVGLRLARTHVSRPAMVAPLLPIAGATAAASFSIGSLFLIFLKIGSVLFGSGYVLLAFLRADLVERLHWLSNGQLIDAIAVGQITPGPVFTTATFIGYLLGGPRAALAATAGIFLPAFVFVALSAPLVPRLRRSLVVGAFLDGVNVASLALMAVVTWQLGRAAIVNPWTAALALVSAVLLVRFRLSSVYLVVGGGMVGLAALLLGH
jgi:chromate transporter